MQGTCGFGPVGGEMPALFADGYVIAPNEAFYRGAGGQASACGECFEITGPRGTMTVIASDICDIACCDNCRGDVAAFDLEQQRWGELVDQPGGNVAISYRWVPCATSGNLRAYFTGGYQAGDRFRLVVYNHRVGVSSVEVRGSAAGATHGNWTALTRTPDNYFDWTGADAGLPIQLRVTSSQGQVVEFPILTALAADQRITATGQFDDTLGASSVSCAWPGPAPVVYDDQLQGIQGLLWRDWGSYMLQRGAPDYAHTGGCQAGAACIDVGAINAWGAIQIGYPNSFPTDFFAGIEFWVRSDGAAFTGLKFYYSGVDAAGASARSMMADVAVTGAWQHVRIDFPPLAMNVSRAQVVRWSNQTNGASPAIFLDEIRFIGR